MRKIILLSSLINSLAYADVYVEGYTKRDGTNVSPHYRSNSDDRVDNNYSYQGNINPYTENVGTKNTESHYGTFFGNTNNNPHNSKLNPEQSPLGGYSNKLGG